MSGEADSVGAFDLVVIVLSGTAGVACFFFGPEVVANVSEAK